MTPLTALWADQRGMTVTTELVLLSALAVTGFVTVAADVRDAIQRKTDQLVEAISSLGELPDTGPAAAAETRDETESFYVPQPLDEYAPSRVVGRSQ